MDEIFKHLDAMGAEVHVMRSMASYSAGDHRWSCLITIKHDGTKVESTQFGATAADALDRAFSRFEGVARFGLPPGAMTPAIEARRHEDVA